MQHTVNAYYKFLRWTHVPGWKVNASMHKHRMLNNLLALYEFQWIIRWHKLSFHRLIQQMKDIKLPYMRRHLGYLLDNWWPNTARHNVTLRKKVTIHQLTTMLATSKNVLFPGHNHLLTTGTDGPTLWLSPERHRVRGHQQTYWWLAGGYDMEIGHF